MNFDNNRFICITSGRTLFISVFMGLFIPASVSIYYDTDDVCDHIHSRTKSILARNEPHCIL